MSYYAAIDGSSVLRILSLVLLVSATSTFLFLTLSIIFAKIPDFPSLQNLVKQRVDHYFDNINQIYTKRGFWWRLVPELLYIEMIIEDRMPEEGINYSDEIEMLNRSKNNNKEEEKLSPKRINESKLGSADVIRMQDSSRSKMSSKSKRTAKVAPVNNPTFKLKDLPINKQLHKSNINSNSQNKPLPFKVDERIKKKHTEISRNESAYDAYGHNSKNHPFVFQRNLLKVIQYRRTI